MQERVIFIEEIINSKKMSFDQAIHYVVENYDNFTLDLGVGSFSIDSELIINKNCKIQGKGDNTKITLNASVKSLTDTYLSLENL